MNETQDGTVGGRTQTVYNEPELSTHNGQSVTVAQLSARLEGTRKLGLSALLASLLLAIAFGYLFMRDKPPALTDPYQIVQNEHGAIRLDRRNGDYLVLEDGVGVFHGNYSLLHDKFYQWEKKDLTEGNNKMTVRLKYSGKMAYCAWRIWPSEDLKKKLATPDEKRSMVVIDFYSDGGVRVLSVSGFWNLARYIKEDNEQVLELQAHVKCSAAIFDDIVTCRVSY